MALSEARYRAVARNLPQAEVSLFDRDLRFILVEGRSLMQSIGMSEATVLGRTIDDVARPEKLDAFRQWYLRTLQGNTCSFEVEHDGRSILIHTTPIRDAQGVITHGMMASYDVSEFRTVELALTQQAHAIDLLHAITLAANVAESSDDAMQGCLQEVCAHLGWPIGHVYRCDGDILVPSDLWHFGDSLWHFASAVDVGRFVERTKTTRMGRGDGFVGRVLELGRPLSTTTCEGFLRAESALVAGLRRGIAFPVLVGSEVVAVLEFYSTTDDETDVEFEILASLGTQLGRVVERERARAALVAHADAVRAMSVRDELTGLYNRRGFMDLAAKLLELAQGTGRCATLLFADLNGMKPINDQLGHEQGDRALVDTANLWRTVFRPSDVIARLGGDEFVVFALDGPLADSPELRARIDREVEAFNALDARPYELSVSIGAASWDPSDGSPPRTLGELLSAADAAMYEEKRRRGTRRAGR